MKSILIVFGFCFALPLSINGDGDSGDGECSIQIEDPFATAVRRHPDAVEMVQAVAEKGESINGALKPLSILGSGGAGFVYRGVRTKDDKPVAIKFFPQKKKKFADREYEMYAYMHTLNKKGVEKYGISAVYYSGDWNKCTVTAHTYLEGSLAHQIEFGSVEPYDILFVIQQFIKQSKYIHSCGVRHDDIKLENFLLRDCESFLIDFDLSSKMLSDNKGYSILMASLRFHQQKNRVATDDWESFLYTMCDLSAIPLEWFNITLKYDNDKDKEAKKQLIGTMKSNRDKTIETIEKTPGIKSPLRHVLVELAKEAFSPNPFPNYDKFDELVTDILAKHFPDKKCFSWVTKNLEGEVADLSYQERINESIAKVHEVKIGDIKVPENWAAYKKHKYPSVNKFMFQKGTILSGN